MVKDYKQPIVTGITFIWAIAFGFFFGQLLWSVMPFNWPVNVTAGYIVGVIVGLLLAHVLNLVKSLVSRTVVALVVLLFVGAVSVSVVRLSADTRLMSHEIQELRDDAAGKNAQ